MSRPTNFKALKEARFNKGSKEHKGDWNSWSKAKLINEAQDEAADLSNYLDKLKEKYPRADVSELQQQLAVIYLRLVLLK